MLPRRLVWLRDVVDFKAIAARLSEFEQYKGISVEKLETVFRQYFWQDETSAWWFFSCKQCQQEIDEMIERFAKNVAASLISD